jgi:hypothetical protein
MLPILDILFQKTILYRKKLGKLRMCKSGFREIETRMAAPLPAFPG